MSSNDINIKITSNVPCKHGRKNEKYEGQTKRNKSTIKNHYIPPTILNNFIIRNLTL